MYFFIFKTIFLPLLLLSYLTAAGQQMIKLPMTLKKGNANFISLEMSSQFIALDADSHYELDRISPLAIRRFYFDKPQHWFLQYTNSGRKDSSFIKKMEQFHLDTTTYAYHPIKGALEVLVGRDLRGNFVAIPDLNHNSVFKDDKHYIFQSIHNVPSDSLHYLIKDCPILKIDLPKWNSGRVDTYARYFRMVPRFYLAFSSSFPPKNKDDSTGLYITPYYHWEGGIQIDSQYYTINLHNKDPQLRFFPHHGNIEINVLKGKVSDAAMSVDKHIYGKYRIGDTIPIGNELYVFNHVSLLGQSIKLNHIGKNSGNLGYSPGSVAAAIKGKDIYGNAFSLSDLRGRWVLLDFWFTGCPPCIEILPELRKLDDRYGDKRLVIISVASYEYNTEKIKNFVKKHRMTWINIMDGGSLVRKYMVGAFPNFALISPSGKIVLRETNVDGFKKIRDYLIKEM